MSMKTCYISNCKRHNQVPSEFLLELSDKLMEEYSHCYVSGSGCPAKDDEGQHLMIDIPADIANAPECRAYACIYEDHVQLITYWNDKEADELFGGEIYEMTIEALFKYLDTIPKSLFDYAELV